MSETQAFCSLILQKLPNPKDFPRRLTAEAVGSAFLLAAVVGSGIMGERLAGGNDAVALLANTFSTGAALSVLLLVFGPVSGGHFNPAVTVAEGFLRGLRWRDVPGYVAVQVIGAVVGVVVANLMFDEPAVFFSQKQRAGAGQWLGEFVATFGLLSVIQGCVRLRSSAVPLAVGGYITAAYWFTSSTSFANPAVTIARTLSDTFAGIYPMHAPAFIVMQFIGAGAATLLFWWLVPPAQAVLSETAARTPQRAAPHTQPVTPGLPRGPGAPPLDPGSSPG